MSKYSQPRRAQVYLPAEVLEDFPGKTPNEIVTAWVEAYRQNRTTPGQSSGEPSESPPETPASSNVPVQFRKEPALHKRIRALKTEGHSVAEIGRRLNVDKHEVLRIAKEIGVMN